MLFPPTFKFLKPFHKTHAEPDLLVCQRSIASSDALIPWTDQFTRAMLALVKRTPTTSDRINIQQNSLSLLTEHTALT